MGGASLSGLSPTAPTAWHRPQFFWRSALPLESFSASAARSTTGEERRAAANKAKVHIIRDVADRPDAGLSADLLIAACSCNGFCSPCSGILNLNVYARPVRRAAHLRGVEAPRRVAASRPSVRVLNPPASCSDAVETKFAHHAGLGLTGNQNSCPP